MPLQVCVKLRCVGMVDWMEGLPTMVLGKLAGKEVEDDHHPAVEDGAKHSILTGQGEIIDSITIAILTKLAHQVNVISTISVRRNLA